MLIDVLTLKILGYLAILLILGLPLLGPWIWLVAAASIIGGIIKGLRTPI